MLEGGVAFSAEGDGDREVLSLGHLLLDGGGIVVEGLPLAAVPVPVEPGGLDVHVEVVGHGVDDPAKGRTGLLPPLLVVGDDVGVAMPELPEFVLVHARVLDFGQEPVVDGKVVGLAKQIVDGDNVSCQIGTIVPE